MLGNSRKITKNVLVHPIESVLFALAIQRVYANDMPNVEHSMFSTYTWDA